MPSDVKSDVDIAGAKYNEGIAKLMRIGKLKGGCHDARTSKNYFKWFSFLQGIRSEINAKLSSKIMASCENEREKADNFEKVSRLWLENKREQIIEISINGEKQKGKVEDIDIYDWLFNYELWLGDMEEKYKFGMPENEDIWLEGENI